MMALSALGISLAAWRRLSSALSLRHRAYILAAGNIAGVVVSGSALFLLHASEFLSYFFSAVTGFAAGIPAVPFFLVGFILMVVALAYHHILPTQYTQHDVIAAGALLLLVLLYSPIAPQNFSGPSVRHLLFLVPAMLPLALIVFGIVPRAASHPRRFLETNLMGNAVALVLFLVFVWYLPQYFSYHHDAFTIFVSAPLLFEIGVAACILFLPSVTRTHIRLGALQVSHAPSMPVRLGVAAGMVGAVVWTYLGGPLAPVTLVPLLLIVAQAWPWRD